MTVLGQSRAFGIQIASKTFRTRLSPTLARTLQNVTTTVIAPFMGRCAAAFHQIIDFPPFGGVCTNYSMTKCTGWVLLPATIRCPFEPTRTAPHQHHARPLGGNALLVASSAVRTTCPLACEHLRLATVSNRAVAG